MLQFLKKLRNLAASTLEHMYLKILYIYTYYYGTRLELGLLFNILNLVELGLFTRRKTRKKSRNRRVTPLIIEQIVY